MGSPKKLPAKIKFILDILDAKLDFFYVFHIDFRR